MKLFKRRQRDERGVTLIVFAISLTALMGMVGVALDGSSAFGERRQMQNSADTAALAGTHELNEYMKYPDTADASQIWTSVQAVATANGAATVECKWVYRSDQENASDVDCSDTSTIADASGVKVTTSSTKDTTFARVLGQQEFTANANATAQVQRMSSPGQDVPFLVCGTGYDTDPNAAEVGPDILIPNLETVDPDDFVLNPDALGAEYNIHGPQINTCGLDPNNYKGNAEDGNADSTIPGYWNWEGGNQAGQVTQDLGTMNGCDGTDTFDDCYMLLPICSGADATNGFYCEMFGVFQVRPGNFGHPSVANTHIGKLIDISVVLPIGVGGEAPAIGDTSPRVVRITD